MRTIVDFVKACRDAGAPLAAVSTADQPALAASIGEAFADQPAVLWTCLDGFVPLTETGRTSVATALNGVDPLVASNPVEMVRFARALSPETIVVLQNAHRFLDEPAVMQGVMSLRDPYKGESHRLAILSGPAFSLPPEIKGDVLTFSVALPERAARKASARSLLEAGGFKKSAKDEGLLDRIADATAGLPPFGAEQALATNLTPDGVDLPGVWSTTFAGLPSGLSARMFARPIDAAGYVPFRESVGRRFQGPNRPRAVVVVSEADKVMTGSTGGDLSGVKAGMLGDLCVYLDGPKSGQPKQGLTLYGLPGTGKDYAAQAIASAFQVPYVNWDLNAMQDSLVGSTGKNVRACLDAIDSLASGNPIFLVSCNRLNSLPPELQRRFGGSGRWFFDVPLAESRAGIWEIQLKNYGLDAKQDRPDDRGWTGAEIRNCCKIAWEEGLTLVEAGSMIVPVTVSSKDEFETLRTGAAGKFLDAQRKGLYAGAVAEPVPTTTVRKLGVVAGKGK